MKTIKWSVALLAVLMILAACSDRSGSQEKYHCPMHPTYVADAPGSCPICGMDLVKMDAATPAPAPSPAAAAVFACPMNCEPPSDTAGKCSQCGMDLVPADGFVCPMLCEPVSDRPGSCGKCGMDLVPVREGVMGEGPASAPEGMAAVHLTEEGVRLSGVRTAEAEEGALSPSIRAAGIVAADETRVRHVHTKIAGWVEKLHVDYTGRFVRAGEPLLDLYSPELLASQEEYLSALGAQRKFQESSLAEVRDGARDLLEAARRRLELFDVPESFIRDLEASGRSSRTVTLDAPASGYALGKEVVEGHRVEPGMELYAITDLSRVWVEAQVYESEAPRVRKGLKGRVLPEEGGSIEGRVSFVDPALDAATRTLRVRLEVPNPGLRLRPGMFAEVVLEVDSTAGVLIPDSAVLDTGDRRIVFVEVRPGLFEPREVETGTRAGGRILVRSGVSAGERVAVRANFLLDSESRLKAALQTGGRPVPSGDEPGHAVPAADPHAAHQH